MPIATYCLASERPGCVRTCSQRTRATRDAEEGNCPMSIVIVHHNCHCAGISVTI